MTSQQTPRDGRGLKRERSRGETQTVRLANNTKKRVAREGEVGRRRERRRE